jgi:hypothetical protein
MQIRCAVTTTTIYIYIYIYIYNYYLFIGYGCKVMVGGRRTHVLHDAKNGSYMINQGQDLIGDIRMHDGGRSLLQK